MLLESERFFFFFLKDKFWIGGAKMKILSGFRANDKY